MISIIGCGNPLRCDDGVGSVVIRELRALDEVRNAQHVRLYDAGTDGLSVMFQARGSDRLIIIDASRTGAEAGALFEVPAEELVKPHQPAMNLHDFRWDHAIYAGHKIFGESFPKDITVYLVEGASFAMGVELTPAVEQTAKHVVERIAMSVSASERRAVNS